MVAEVLSGKPLLLGSSTAKQLVKILQVTGGVPTDQDLEAMGVPLEKHAAFKALHSSILSQRRRRAVTSRADRGLDLVSQLLHLRPATAPPSRRCSRTPTSPHSSTTTATGMQYANASLLPLPATPPAMRVSWRRRNTAFLSATHNGLAEQLCDESLAGAGAEHTNAEASMPSEADMGC